MDVSCIVLCTFNDLFVRQRLIPSIIEHSDMATTEIIVVDNGPGQDLAVPGAQVIRSEPYHIPRGYNRGVAAAQGRTLALFHDDCLLNDPRWLEKATAALDDEVWAVGPDVRIKNYYSYLKEVPLVMERSKFLQLGGYDESHYLGYQADLLCIAIEERGKKIDAVDIDCTHFCIPGKSIGMSTALLLSTPSEREELRRVFAAPDFSLSDMDRLVDGFTMQMRIQYFFDYLLVRPTLIYMNKKYGHLPESQRPPTDKLVRDRILTRIMPSTREEMDQLIFALGYFNELFERIDRIPVGEA